MQRPGRQLNILERMRRVLVPTPTFDKNGAAREVEVTGPGVNDLDKRCVNIGRDLMQFQAAAVITRWRWINWRTRLVRLTARWQFTQARRLADRKIADVIIRISHHAICLAAPGV